MSAERQNSRRLNSRREPCSRRRNRSSRSIDLLPVPAVVSAMAFRRRDSWSVFPTRSMARDNKPQFPANSGIDRTVRCEAAPTSRPNSSPAPPCHDPCRTGQRFPRAGKRDDDRAAVCEQRGRLLSRCGYKDTPGHGSLADLPRRRLTLNRPGAVHENSNRASHRFVRIRCCPRLACLSALEPELSTDLETLSRMCLGIRHDGSHRVPAT